MSLERNFQMDTELFIKLIDEGIIDFNKMILKNYKLLGINETEAFVIIELHNQKKKGGTFLNPAKIVKNLSMSADDLLPILDGLIKKGLIYIDIVVNESGKESEVFQMTKVVTMIINHYQKAIEEAIVNKPKNYATQEEELVDLLETEFQKQLTPLEIEIIRKWVSEDKFSVLDIKKAVLDAIKANKYTLSYVDGILVKRRTAQNKTKEVEYKKEDSAALKTFFESWQK